VVGGVTLRTLVSGVVVAGVELLVTDGGVAAVVCAVTVWGVISGGACGVVIGVVVMVSALTGGGAGGGAYALDSAGDTALGVGVGAVALTTAGATGVSRCSSRLHLSTSAPISRTSSSAPSTSLRVRRTRASVAPAVGVSPPKAGPPAAEPPGTDGSVVACAIRSIRFRVRSRSHAGAGMNTGAAPSSATGLTSRRRCCSHVGQDSIWRAAPRQAMVSVLGLTRQVDAPVGFPRRSTMPVT